MKSKPDPIRPEEELTARRPYVKPAIQRVDLALAETLGEGCKLTEPCPIEEPEFFEPGS